MRVKRRLEALGAPEGDGVRICLFPLSYEEGSISRDPQEIVFCLTSTHVTVKPPAQETSTVLLRRCLYSERTSNHTCSDK